MRRPRLRTVYLYGYFHGRKTGREDMGVVSACTLSQQCWEAGSRRLTSRSEQMMTARQPLPKGTGEAKVVASCGGREVGCPGQGWEWRPAPQALPLHAVLVCEPRDCIARGKNHAAQHSTHKTAASLLCLQPRAWGRSTVWRARWLRWVGSGCRGSSWGGTHPSLSGASAQG